ncbi:hypothetical protein NADFUDRAFT_48769 [Nadsonia fulvescens var. elongata DSM 6958]|uniref:U3 small nucleolar RNA-associated protein 6 N-terminal domain-containing protein n=1 Tax=Nadsonia fulvescens var. elongata DSM 6958 TaxID=857566 RepID=A0A1E3PS94_9ASCO|nr:hypothetical protein NADFUDRAFT_48769 [Nadsonia fulvescens var. elongata DSM 6958]
MSEKVRYYLEQSIPELEDLKKKGLFTKDELTNIMRKRTDFEHRIAGRAARSRDFIKYAQFEINLESLRRKRVARLGPGGRASVSDWAGSKRVFFIFDRATKKFLSDMTLWTQYIDYAKKQNAIQILTKIFTRLLQLHPTKPGIWVMAAKYEMEENASMKAARSLMQRGLRFNKDSEQLWLEYTKLELIYVSKILARRKLLGLLTEKEQMEAELTEVADETNGDNKSAEDDSVIHLPEVTNEEMKEELKSLPDADISMLGNVETNPALRGDVALAIFDSAMGVLYNDLESDSQLFATSASKTDKAIEFSIQILKLFNAFSDIDREYLCDHVLTYMLSHLPQPNVEIILLDINLPLRFMTHIDVRFPDQLKLAINKYNTALAKTYASDKALKSQIATRFRESLETYLSAEPPLDANLALVIKSVIKKCTLQEQQ